MPDDEEMPELANNEHWRGVMARARKEHNLSQEQLANDVGVSQVIISRLETQPASSKYILRICRRLSIPPPEHFEDEDLRAWNELGRFLRARAPEQYEAQSTSIKLLVKLLKDAQKDAQTAEPEDAEEKNGTRPLRRQ